MKIALLAFIAALMSSDAQYVAVNNNGQQIIVETEYASFERGGWEYRPKDMSCKTLLTDALIDIQCARAWKNILVAEQKKRDRENSWYHKFYDADQKEIDRYTQQYKNMDCQALKSKYPQLSVCGWSHFSFEIDIEDIKGRQEKEAQLAFYKEHCPEKCVRQVLATKCLHPDL